MEKETKKQTEKDNITLERIAKVLLRVDKGEISDKNAIDRIMKIMVKS